MRPRLRHAPPRGWSDPELEAIAELLRAATGLVFPLNRQGAAEQGIRRAMASVGIQTLPELRRAIEGAGPARDAVLAELTVGETYFFREPAQLAFIAREVLPALAAARASASGSTRPLRIWSAACASGEEPYSLAIMLREAGWAYPVEILGTDIALPRLSAARRGRYTPWSMRGVAESTVERWFERQGRHYIVRPEIRRMVRFAPLNLADASWPSVEMGTTEVDLLLCRNVLIYFDAASIAAIAERLIASLSPDGWLFVGASDPPLAELTACDVVTTGAGLAYRREGAAQGAPAPHLPWGSRHLLRTRPTLVIDGDTGGEGSSESAALDLQLPAASRPPVEAVRELAPEGLPAPPSPEPVAPAATAPSDEMEAAYAAAEYERAAAAARRRIARDHEDERAAVVLVRALANLGRLAEADAACVAAMDACRTSAELYYLHALLVARAGLARASVQAARRALYLDRGLAVAHVALGDALARLGDVQGARRAFANALAAVGEMEDSAPVALGDGETAGRVRRVARHRMASLPDAAAS